MSFFECPRIRVATLLLAVAGGAALAGGTATTGPAGTGEARILARVNGEPITETQVLRRLKAVDPKVEMHRDNPNRWSRLLESATEAEIRDRLLLQAARTEGLGVSAAELDAALARSREMLGKDRFAELLAKRGASEADYKTFLADRLLIDKYSSKITGGITLDEETLRDYSRGHKESFVVPARVRLETVEVADSGLMGGLTKRLKDGQSLEEIVDPEAGIHTSEGWIDERDLPLELRKAVEDASAGDVLGPIEWKGRIRVVRVRERQPSRKLSYRESKDLIRKRLLGNREQAALDAWYEQAKARAKIEYR
jgi:hypothetical protein